MQAFPALGWSGCFVSIFVDIFVEFDKSEANPNNNLQTKSKLSQLWVGADVAVWEPLGTAASLCYWAAAPNNRKKLPNFRLFAIFLCFF